MKKLLALTAGILLVASTAFAKTMDTGTIELSGSSDGYFSSRSGAGTVNIFHLGVAGLYYPQPNLGVGGLFDFTNYGGDADGSSFSFGGEATYNFSIDQAVNVYTGVKLGYTSSDDRTAADGVFLGAAGGVKYFFTDSASVNSGLSFSHNFGDGSENSFGISVGLSIYLE